MPETPAAPTLACRICLAAIAILISNCGSARAQADDARQTAIPITWTKYLELSSPQNLNAEMSRKFEPIRFSTRDQQSGAITNCHELLERYPSIYNVPTKDGSQRLEYEAIRCFALREV